MPKEGFDVEASELERGASIKKLCLLTLDAIIKILKRIAYEVDEQGELPATICFEEAELECIEMQCKRLEGKTEK